MIQLIPDCQELLKPASSPSTGYLEIPLVSTLATESEETLARQHAETLNRLETEQREELEEADEKLNSQHQQDQVLPSPE